MLAHFSPLTNPFFRISFPYLRNDSAYDWPKEIDYASPSVAQKAPLPQAVKCQNSSKIRVSRMSLQMLILLRLITNDHHFLPKKAYFKEMFCQFRIHLPDICLTGPYC